MGNLLLAIAIVGGMTLFLAVAVLLIRQRRHGGDGAASTPGGHHGAARKSGNAGADHRQAVDQSAEAVREVLLFMAESVRHLESAEGRSTEDLHGVRQSVDGLTMPPDLAEAQQVLLAEIDRVLKANGKLRTDLNKAKKGLIKQRGIIDTLTTAVRVDRLTQVSNRAHFDEHIVGALDRLKRYGEPFALLLVDIDHFKQVNDTHGHLAGDRVLRGLAQKLKVSTRGSDFVARYGGEEFAVILVKASLTTARDVAEGLRDGVETSVFQLESEALRVTVSVGVAEALPDDTVEALIQRADESLYRAKQTGRNRVCVAGDQT